jgi:O-antigen/teichoic acid export membrane protein
MGLFFGPVAVGLYRFAQRLIGMVVQVTTNSLQVAAFPQFSRVQDDVHELRRSALLCLRMSSIVTLPLMAGIAASSRFIMEAIGAKWAPAAPALTALAIAGATSSLVQFTGPLLQAKSKPHYLAGLVWTSSGVAISALVAVAVLLRHSPVSVQVSNIALARVLIVLMFDLPVNWYFFSKETKLSARELGRALFPALAASAGVACVTGLFSMQTFALRLPPFLGLSVSILLSAISAGGLLLLCDRELRNWIVNFDPAKLNVGGLLCARAGKEQRPLSFTGGPSPESVVSNHMDPSPQMHPTKGAASE